MKIELIDYTPLAVCAKAIRACWDSHHKSDNGGEKDKELIYRVGNKYKHQSVLEHLRIQIKVSNLDRDNTIILFSIFSTDPYSKSEFKGDKALISTNVRTLQNLPLDDKLLQQLLPQDYLYLFDIKENQ